MVSAPIESLMVDPSVTDILVNGLIEFWSNETVVLESTNIRFADSAHLMQFIHRLVGRAGRRIDDPAQLLTLVFRWFSIQRRQSSARTLRSNGLDSTLRESSTANGRYDQVRLLAQRWLTS